jgi:hypothetical protein
MLLYCFEETIKSLKRNYKEAKFLVKSTLLLYLKLQLKDLLCNTISFNVTFSNYFCS